MGYQNYITGVGKAVLHRMLASDKLILTKVVASSMTAQNPEELMDVVPANQFASQLTVSPHGTYTDINFVLDCRTLATSYEMRMIGIYGKIHGENEEHLIYVLVCDNESSTTISAGSELIVNYSVKEVIGSGQIVVEISDDMSCPASHLSDNSRHLLAQVNEDSSTVMIPSGVDNSFSNGDVFVFIPKVDITSTAVMSIGGTLLPLVSVDSMGCSTPNNFTKAIPVGLTYNNGQMVFKRITETQFVSGIMHYWDGACWRSVQMAGEMIWSFASSIPQGYLYCDGSACNKTVYPELFNAIGYSYGGSGDSFNLPDMRGRFPICDGGGISFTTKDGAKTVTLKSKNIPSHDHTFYHRHKYARHPFTTEQTWASSLVVASGPLLQGVWVSNSEAALTNGPCDDEQSEATMYTSKAYNDAPNSFSIMPPYLCAKCLITTGKSLV